MNSPTLIFLFTFICISLTNASTGFVTFDNISNIDFDVLIIFAAGYGFIFFAPVFCSVFFVFKRPRSIKAEREFNDKWYRWSKQYIWHELMFRTNIILIMALIVIFIFESEWPIWAPFAVIGTCLFMCIVSKLVSCCIAPRILTEEQKKRFQQMKMHESTFFHKDNVYGQELAGSSKSTYEPYRKSDKEFAAEFDKQRARMSTFSFKRTGKKSGYGTNVISRMSFKRGKSYKDKAKPLLGDYDETELLTVN